MRKQCMSAILVATAIIVSGSALSVQNVSAKDAQIKVVSNSKTATVKTVASKSEANTDNVINIEVVSDKDSISSKAVKSGSVAGISYDKLVMANVDEAVNVRDSASEDGKLIGKFYKECAGTILEKGNGWTKIKTGELTGWVKNDFLLFGSDAAELADKVVEKTATSTADCLRVRQEADPDASVLDLLAKGDQISVLEEEGEWVKVEFSDGEVGYVSSEYVKVADTLGTGETIESINAKEEALKKEKEEALAASKKDSDKDSKSEKASSENKEPEKTVTNAVAADCSDQVLLAALIQAEAGSQPYEGQVAVGNVVVNRLTSGRYGNSLYSVIYAKGQFGPAGSGIVAQNIAKGPKASCMQAAADALAGVNYIGSATHFRNVKSGYTGIVIGAHVFW